jgi:hypothetical protein
VFVVQVLRPKSGAAPAPRLPVGNHLFSDITLKALPDFLMRIRRAFRYFGPTFVTLWGPVTATQLELVD